MLIAESCLPGIGCKLILYIQVFPYPGVVLTSLDVSTLADICECLWWTHLIDMKKDLNDCNIILFAVLEISNNGNMPSILRSLVSPVKNIPICPMKIQHNVI